MSEKEFEERRDKLLQIYTNQAHPAYEAYLAVCRSKKCECDYNGYKALQRELKRPLEKLFKEIAGLKKQVV